MAPLKTSTEDVSSDPTVKAELLNDYFSSTFQIDNKVIPNCPPPLPTLSFEPRFTIAKVKTLMRKLNSKSAGDRMAFILSFLRIAMNLYHNR